MEIIRDRNDLIYSEKNRILGNCFTIHDNNQKFHYEFDIRKNEALITCDSIYYIEKAINEFRKYNKNINIYYNVDRSFYKAFDEVFTFKLPIYCIQVSKFIIDKDHLDFIENNLNEDNIYLPVCIIDDEYVLIDGHARLLALYRNYNKLVNVYLDEPSSNLDDFVYVCKENNIFNINKINVLSKDEYNQFCHDFLDINKKN